VINALLVAERRSVLPQADSDRFLSRLSSLPILTEAEPTSERRARMLALARGHGLSSYDATYLELAQRLGAALASFDRQLNQAAHAIGVKLYLQP
jgi:predicted nucleic acid-binding protein